jgi:hypothetical protein
MCVIYLYIYVGMYGYIYIYGFNILQPLGVGGSRINRQTMTIYVYITTYVYYIIDRL